MYIYIYERNFFFPITFSTNTSQTINISPDLRFIFYLAS